MSTLREKQVALINLYECFLSELQLINMPNSVFDRGLSLRAQYNLKTPDALHLATAQYHGCNYFWTNDNRLSAIVPRFAVNVLSAR
ncbi:MAG: PIN domain-containing protein [Pseudomonadota bacterium]|nr:PIN domain-containing protein [Pseudomonadota bacterium]